MLRYTHLWNNAAKTAFLELVKELRFRTEAPISDCRAALKETDGDVQKAMEALRQKGSAKALKKGSRVTEQGCVVACVGAPFGAAIITVCTETDFAARNDHFQNLCEKVRAAFQAQILGSEGAVLADPTEAHKSLVEVSTENLRASIAVLGENITIKGIQPLRVAPHVSADIAFGAYTHGVLGVPHVGRIAGLVAVSREDPLVEVPPGTLVDVARHFVACSGAEGNYAHQDFFGTEETVGKWLKRHGLRFSSSLVMEFGKEPILHTAPQPCQ